LRKRQKIVGFENELTKAGELAADAESQTKVSLMRSIARLLRKSILDAKQEKS